MLCHKQLKEPKSNNQAVNNQAAMETIYLEYERLIRHFLYKTVCDKEAIADLTHVVLENLFNKVNKLKTYDKDHLAAYVIATTRHVAYNYNKRWYKESALFCVEQADIPSVPYPVTESVVEEEVFRNETIEYCRKEMTKLSEHDQWLLYSKYILQMSNEELAKQANCKPDSIRMKLTRARKAAKKLFNKKDGDGLL